MRKRGVDDLKRCAALRGPAGEGAPDAVRRTGYSRRFRIRSNIGAESRFPDRPGKTSSFVCGISLKIAAASSDSGTRKVTPAFMRAPGRFRSRPSRSTSLQRSPRISPDRIPVSMSSRNAVLAVPFSSPRRLTRSGIATSGTAAWWPFTMRCLPSRFFAQSAGLSPSRRRSTRAWSRIRSGDRGYALLSQA